MLIELLRSGAAEAPEKPLVVTDHGTTTYGEALAGAEAIARGLRGQGIDRFAAVVRDPARLLELLCGSSAAGSEACVFRADLDPESVGQLVRQFGQEILITDDPLPITDPRQLAVDDLLDFGDWPMTPPTSAPVLILTTGTTGRQKGARHDWSRLVQAQPTAEPGIDARWLLAYNLNQFAGIQLLLHVLASRGTLVVGASTQPREAVAAWRRHGVTHVSATPTFWRFALQLFDGEAPSLRQITLGGEAVPGPLLGQLRERFPDARISQVYASTEFGSAVSVRDGLSGLPISVLERDDDAPVRFRVVDGELHARSNAGMLGYEGEAEQEVGWRPTGDLVEIRGDRLIFVGRTSDTINVGGVKVHPLPVEELVGAIEGVSLVRAYGRASPVTGEILAVDVVATPGADVERLTEAIRSACATLGPAARPRRIRFVPTIETRGSKIARPSGAAS
jgi:acyl-CoA synthetase (AMP-forming)/AMP-acid ligase II